MADRRRSSAQGIAVQEEGICHLVWTVEQLRKDGKKRSQAVYLSQNGGKRLHRDYRIFSTTDSCIQYNAFCDDFGPMSALSIMSFIERLDLEISDRSQQSIVYVVEEGPRALTNGAFLLGAYMILKLNHNAVQVAECFRGLPPSLFEPYRDASYAKPDFGLELVDCWKGLEKGKIRGWIDIPSFSAPSLWGMIDKDAYAHYDNALNADLHEVVPQKLIAFRGPKALGSREFTDTFQDGVFVCREFSPQYYVDIFDQLGVSTIIRMKEAQYDADCFVSEGFEHHDLYFEDCSSPPPAVVSRFFKIVDEAKGAVAIHGRAGLGRTGTLIGLDLMRTYSFTAREAIAWLRIMRPGAIIGRQQHFLVETERSILSLIADRAQQSRAAVTPSVAVHVAAARGRVVTLRKFDHAPGRPQQSYVDAAAAVADGNGAADIPANSISMRGSLPASTAAAAAEAAAASAPTTPVRAATPWSAQDQVISRTSSSTAPRSTRALPSSLLPQPVRPVAAPRSAFSSDSPGGGVDAPLCSSLRLLRASASGRLSLVVAAGGASTPSGEHPPHRVQARIIRAEGSLAC